MPDLLPVVIDLETRSPCDLRKEGGHRYAADPMTRLLTDCHVATMAGWGTPTATQPGGTGEQYVARSVAKTGNLTPTMLAHQVALVGPARLTATGELLTGSDAGMASGGPLRPGHSRWLMGYPIAWDLCAPLPKRRGGK